MMIAAVLIVLPLSSCGTKDIEAGSIDDVLAVVPAQADGVISMTWGDVPTAVRDGITARTFAEAAGLADRDFVVAIRGDEGGVLVAPISDAEAADRLSDDCERIEVGTDGISGRVLVGTDGSVVLCRRCVWMLPEVNDAQHAAKIVSDLLDAAQQRRMHNEMAQWLKDNYTSGAAIVGRLDDYYIAAAMSRDSLGVSIRGEVRDSLGTECDFGKYLQPVTSAADAASPFASAVGIRKGALARAVDKVSGHINLGVSEKLAVGILKDLLRNSVGTLRINAGQSAPDAIHVSVPFDEGGARDIARRLGAMLKRFAPDKSVHISTVGDNSLELAYSHDAIARLLEASVGAPATVDDRQDNPLASVRCSLTIPGLQPEALAVSLVIDEHGFRLSESGQSFDTLLSALFQL